MSETSQIEGLSIVEATIDDLDFLLELEQASFDEGRRESKRTIKRSVMSKHQTVMIVKDQEGNAMGSVIFRQYKKSLRVISIAVLQVYQHMKIGSLLMDLIFEYAMKKQLKQLTLEVDPQIAYLVNWYEQLGFEKQKLLENYYATERPAYKMVLNLDKKRKSLVVVESHRELFVNLKGIDVISPEQYLSAPETYTKPYRTVYNLCDSFESSTNGYFVSLVGLARKHNIIPSVGMIRDLGNKHVLNYVSLDLENLFMEHFKDLKDNKVKVRSIFGVAEEDQHQGLIDILQTYYPAPLVDYHFQFKGKWVLYEMDLLNTDVLLSSDGQWQAASYLIERIVSHRYLKTYEYDLAILVDGDEVTPPSNGPALNLFKAKAEERGFYVEFITKKDYARLCEFDALFIRTTTRVEDYTYEFARTAYSEGLVVMDDPWSIMSCSNKVFLFEALMNANIDIPKTTILMKENYKAYLADVAYPLVLKLPESAFSKGVFKVQDSEEALAVMDGLLEISDLVVAQEYLPTDYDWRIGILNKKPIFAVKYYMVPGHWQIAQWEDGDACAEGHHETVALSDVPAEVLKQAVKAAGIIGDGLYGVDLKLVGDQVLIIEVNDNPNIDHGVEDAVAGTMVYEQIIQEFYKRIVEGKNSFRYLT